MSLTERLAPLRGIASDKQRAPVVVGYEGWMPDRARFANPGEVEANGVRPTVDGYAPLPALSNEATAITARAQGAGQAKDSAGNVRNYAGDAAKLYEIVNGAPNDISGATYAIAAHEQWGFVQDDTLIIASHIDDPVQAATVGSGNFANLFTSTNKPQGRHVAKVRDFLVLGNTWDAVDLFKPNRIWWSALGNNVDMDPDADTQADYNDFDTGGWVQKVVGNDDYGLIFFETEIRRMDYVGSPLVFSVNTKIDQQRGTPIPGSVIAYGRMVFSIAEDGFFMTDGVTNRPIGHKKVDNAFWNQFDTTYASRVSAAIDPINKIVMWAFPGTGNSGEPNKLFMCNWADDFKWSEADVDCELIFDSFTEGLTLDELDTISATIDGLPFSLDSRAYAAGQRRLGAFDTSHRMSSFTGSNVAAQITTGERQLFTGQVADVKSVRPLTDGGTITCSVAGRKAQQDTVTFGSAVALETEGYATIDDRNRFQSFRQNIAAAGTWTHSQGMIVDAAPDGVI